ncbi:hypothetical protein LTR78_002148 [Recurvomyces mirabilis]|uniref:Uncharacterized protein n=1 Tax=Recurvomyces mirabilis TaxID=574656 RepID=A0AAE0WU24_9PEZI|nr:hypothetical protein LTR78_002148 [Recurvomyces mirabilis]KAK5160605.1 hypothetical protein LTS14_001617 [Recurvomyces mirabilis]
MSTDELKALSWPFPNPKYIFFTDFDGTITLQDSNDYMVRKFQKPGSMDEVDRQRQTDNLGFGGEKRRQGNKDVLDNKESFRDSFRKMMDSIKTPFPECVEYLVQNIQLDPHFNEYFQWSLKNNIPTVVLSGGMYPVIRAILDNLVGKDADKIEIVCNEAIAREGKKIDEEGGWQIKYHDESGFGHDKSLTIRPYANLPAGKRPTLFYAGDGVSDLSAASETDLLFAKKGRDLVEYCVKKDVPFTLFEDWSSIHQKVQEIVEGQTTVKDAAHEGWEMYKNGQAGLNGKAK